MHEALAPPRVADTSRTNLEFKSGSGARTRTVNLAVNSPTRTVLDHPRYSGNVLFRIREAPPGVARCLAPSLSVPRISCTICARHNASLCPVGHLGLSADLRCRPPRSGDSAAQPGGRRASPSGTERGRTLGKRAQAERGDQEAEQRERDQELIAIETAPALGERLAFLARQAQGMAARAKVARNARRCRYPARQRRRTTCPGPCRASSRGLAEVQSG